MPVFAYKAMNYSREPVRGAVSADSPRQARDILRGRGLTVQEIFEKRADVQHGWWPLRRSGRYAGRLASVVRELATLLGVGIPLTESLDTVALQYRGHFHSALLLLRDQVEAGVSLADAMAAQPDIFDPLCIHMVEVGEATGTLDQVLSQLADFNERSLELKDRVVSALAYPTIVLAMSVGVSLFLMTVVVPMLLSNLIEAGRTLPWPTRVLKAVSDTLTGHGWWLAILSMIGIVAIIMAKRTTAGQRLWHRTLLRLPMFGNMARKQAIARASLVMSTMLRSGIVFVKAAEIAARSSRNVILREALEQTVREVEAGADIGEALARTEVFPPVVVQVFAVGQKSGQLEVMLARLATDYDRQVASLASRLTTVLEPILILFLAVVVGFILFATILPILEAGNVL